MYNVYIYIMYTYIDIRVCNVYIYRYTRVCIMYTYIDIRVYSSSPASEFVVPRSSIRATISYTLLCIICTYISGENIYESEFFITGKNIHTHRGELEYKRVQAWSYLFSSCTFSLSSSCTWRIPHKKKLTCDPWARSCLFLSFRHMFPFFFLHIKNNQKKKK